MSSNANWEIVKGKWKEVTGDLKSKWGKLTDNDLKEIEGDREKLIGKVQQHYGHARKDAEKAVDEFCKSCDA